MSRVRLSTDLEKSIAEGAIIVTDSNKEAYWYAPINPDDILIIDFTTGVPRWSQDITVNGTMTLTRENNGEANRILSQDAGGLVSARENIQIYKNIHSVSGTPSLTIGAGAGVGAGATFSISGTNDAGLINITTGSTTASVSNIANVLFNTLVYPNGAAVVLYPASDTAANLSGTQAVYVTSTATDWNIMANITPLLTSTNYQWFYVVKGF